MSEAARSHRPDVRVEPFMEPPAVGRSNAGNPLAELAQLVGQDDPFRRMFRKGNASAEPVAAAPAPAMDYAYHSEVAEAHHGEDADENYDRSSELRPSNHDVEEWHQDAADVGHWNGETFEPHPDDASHGGHDDERYEPEARMPIDSPRYVAPPMTPDLWAGHNAEAEETAVVPNAAAQDVKSPRRPLMVLMAVLALTGGGLGATFLSRSGASVAVADGATPTIMAASGPTKIKQADGASDTTPEDADAALLSKNGTSSGGAVKVVNSQEQPIDLSQLPKPAASTDAASSDASAPFPAPKKVKTFLVRPDGSLVNGAAAPARSAMPQLAAGGLVGGDVQPSPAARPSTPKTVSHTPTTPKAPPASIADAVAADPAPAKSAETGPASDTTATSSGNFALQLAASPSEQDARSAFTKLQKKYSELSGFQPTVKKVDNGQKTVYRLRVANLSQDHAKTLCSQLQANGGSCFVVRN